MEAVATLGLAANVLQLINFLADILSKGKEIYMSADGASKDNLAIEVIVRHLKDTLSQIQELSSITSSNVNNLQDECTKLVDELLTALEDLKVQGKPSRWKSVRKALKSVQSKGKIEQWLQRLESIREAYNTQLEIEILYARLLSMISAS